LSVPGWLYSLEPPQIAAESPSTATKILKTEVTAGTVQLQVLLNNSAPNVCAAHTAASACGIRRVIGNQNTEKPYAMPMLR
jgi:hypothetical protein